MKKLDYMYTLLGVKFYYDYLMILNPYSKNKIIRFFSKYLVELYDAKNVQLRIVQAICMIIIHALIAVYFIKANIILNLLFNIYPIFCQLMIIERIKSIYNNI